MHGERGGVSVPLPGRIPLPGQIRYGCFRREGADASGDGWPSLDHHHHRRCRCLAKPYAPNHLPQVITYITIVE
jgi:hypothetical protein